MEYLVVYLLVGLLEFIWINEDFKKAVSDSKPIDYSSETVDSFIIGLTAILVVAFWPIIALSQLWSIARGKS